MARSKSQLETLVRRIVREEIADALPTLMADALSSGIVAEAIASLGGHLCVDDDDECQDVPSPLDNGTEGIYSKSPIVKESNELLSSDNPLAFVYEGVVPTPVNQPQQAVAADDGGIPLELLGFDVKRASRISNVVQTNIAARMPARKSPQAIERDIDVRRKILESVVVGYSGSM